VQPLRPAADPEAGLVQVLDRRGLDPRAYGVGEPLGAPGAGPAHPGDGRGHQPDAEQVGHRLGQPVLGQKLVVQQVDHDRQEARAILHRGRDPLGKQRPGFPAAPAAAAAIRPMLGDDQRLRLGQIEHLARAAPRGHRGRQRQTAGPTGLGVVIDGDVRSGDLAQGLTFFCPPGGLPDGSRRLRVRGSRCGLCSPSLDGGLPLLELFSPSRRSNSATRASNTAMVSWSAAFSVRSRAFSSASAAGVATSSEGAVRGVSSAGVMDRLTHMPSPASTGFLKGLPGQ
jgi:hypothetical protein